jgi:hypothetical protein
MADLYLPLKRIYFDAIKSGEKPDEYRLITPFWTKRIVGREYDGIILTMGYPAKDDAEKRLWRPWRGFRRLEGFTHHHFGDEPVDVFAILVN